ncbi:MAG: DUF1761 domain-containing protein [Alphaproteobacteria bacterium]
MEWIVARAILVAGFLGTLSDWLFMGVLFHERYHRYPEVWWPAIREKGGDKRAIIYSSIVSFLTAAGVVLLCAYTNTATITGGVIVAVLAWLGGPLVVTVTNGLWVKRDPMITVAHSVGHLARMLIAGVAGAVALQLAS